MPRLLRSLVCVQCKKEFLSRTASRQFCGNACKKQHKQQQLQEVCQECGKDYTRKNYHSKHVSFCSIACANTFTNRNKSKKIKLVCVACGKTYLKPPSAAEQSNYCSLKCSGTKESAKKNLRPTRTCQSCGKSYQKAASVDNTRFCSYRCKRIHKGESSIEQAVREALETLKIPFEQEYQVGRYYLDFYLPQFQVGIEADGEYWHREERAERDARKDTFIASQGICTIRLKERDINEDALTLVRTSLAAFI